jgi:hypothetical protein
MKEAREINPFGLRMPPDLRAKLEEAAAASGRSLNAELLHRIASTFEPEQLSLDLGDIKRAVHAALQDAGLVKPKAKKRSRPK